VAARCAARGVPCHAVVGVSRLSAERAAQLGVDGVIEAGTITALHDAGVRLATLATGGRRMQDPN
jgi:hypothetical protein